MKSSDSLPPLPGSSAAKTGVLFVAGAQLGGLICTIGQILVVGMAVDRILSGAGNLAGLMGVFLLLLVVRAVLQGIVRVAGHECAARVKAETRQGILRQIFLLGPQRSEERTGRLVFQAVEGAEALDVFYGLFRPQLIVGLAAPLLICASVAVLDLPTAVVMLISAPLAPLLMGLMQTRFRKVSARYHARAGLLSAQFLDSVQGLPVLKMFNRGRAQGDEIWRTSEALRRETMRLLAVNQLAIFLMDWGFALGVTTAAFLAATIRWRAGALSTGEAVAVVLLSTEVIRQLNLLGAFFFAGAGGRAMITTIRGFLGKKPVVKDRLRPVCHSYPTPPDIRFEGVRFTYDEGDGPALDGVTFAIRSGETLALAGESGAGKSSIAHLLLRFADPQAGRILLNGRPLPEYSIRWLRSQISLVAQDTWLFHGSIADNLRIARPGASQTDLESAARAASLHDFILSLTDGYHTQLGERGARLSGGQAQRLAIGRALLKNAPILILDEPTSHLDAQNEQGVMQAIRHASQGKTVLHITHRLHTVAGVDRLLFLRDGRLVDEQTAVLH
jgi:ABC-type transport system involved in cytochrome bd biosynthesis fused ATPase/permease subunit